MNLLNNFFLVQVTNGAVVSTVEGSSVTASVTSKHYYGGGKVSGGAVNGSVIANSCSDNQDQ